MPLGLVAGCASTAGSRSRAARRSASICRTRPRDSRDRARTSARRAAARRDRAAAPGAIATFCRMPFDSSAARASCLRPQPEHHRAGRSMRAPDRSKFVEPGVDAQVLADGQPIPQPGRFGEESDPAPERAAGRAASAARRRCVTDPLVGPMSPASIRIVVVLPAPFGPSSATISDRRDVERHVLDDGASAEPAGQRRRDDHDAHVTRGRPAGREGAAVQAASVRGGVADGGAGCRRTAGGWLPRDRGSTRPACRVPPRGDRRVELRRRARRRSRAAISAPKPQVSWSSCAMTTRLVRFTCAAMDVPVVRGDRSQVEHGRARCRPSPPAAPPAAPAARARPRSRPRRRCPRGAWRPSRTGA